MVVAVYEAVFLLLGHIDGDEASMPTPHFHPLLLLLPSLFLRHRAAFAQDGVFVARIRVHAPDLRRDVDRPPDGHQFPVTGRQIVDIFIIFVGWSVQQ